VVADRFAGRVAVVTGGAAGLGLATVERFLAEGARVVVGDLNTDRGAALVAAAEADDVADRVRFSPTDVSIESDVEALVALAVESFGRLDVLFNNAGIGGAFGPITELEVDDWDATFAVNTRSVFLGVKGIEYAAKFRDHVIPGRHFEWHGTDATGAQIFYSLYFMLTGLHAIHMIVGIGIMLVILFMAWRGRFDSTYYTPVEVAGLYWHFVDIVWIFLFPLLYLI
jgi:hypothetical protein